MVRFVEVCYLHCAPDRREALRGGGLEGTAEGGAVGGSELDDEALARAEGGGEFEEAPGEVGEAGEGWG
jgi:hypothetical protein